MNLSLGHLARSSLISVTLALACSSGSSSPGGPTGPKGRGTPACNQWQSAVCAWATMCNSPGATTCQEQANSISCSSDDKAQSCANLLASATCTTLPAGCDLRDLAKSAHHGQTCNQFIDAACVWNTRCDPATTTEACHAQLLTMVDCTKVIGIKLAFEQCMTEMKALTCDATTLPAVCNGVLLRGA